MKKMTCRQIGGACDHVFEVSTFDELAEKSKIHGMEMFQKGDAPHLQAMEKMKGLMGSPQKMQEWMEERKREFEALPEE